MPKNSYFNFNDKHNTNEINLYENLNQECNQIRGVVINYFPKSIINKDEIFLDSRKNFDKFYEIPAVFSNFENFEGDDLYTKFGLNMNRGIEFEISIKEFNDCVNGEIDYPEIGDIFYLKNLNDWFEITHINSEKRILPFGTKMIYTFNAKKIDVEDELITSSDDVELKEDFESIVSKFGNAYEDIKDGVDEFLDDMSLINDRNNPFGEY